MNKTLFDVAITTYQRSAFTLAAVKSCLSQGPLLNKVIVVDDAGTDDTKEKIAALGDPRVVYYRRMDNGGIGASRRDSFALSSADWTISLDSDHELLDGALQHLYDITQKIEPCVGILGARYLWDNGNITPAIYPTGPIDYIGRIQWCNLPNSIGTDYLCCISRKVRETIQWYNWRGGLIDILFHLDIMSVSKALYTKQCLAYQKSNAPMSHTRAQAYQRFCRRQQDAFGVVETCKTIINKHGHALQTNGPTFYSNILLTGAFSAFLLGNRKQALSWIAQAIRLDGISIYSFTLLFGILAGKKVFKTLYMIRG